MAKEDNGFMKTLSVLGISEVVGILGGAALADAGFIWVGLTVMLLSGFTLVVTLGLLVIGMMVEDDEPMDLEGIMSKEQAKTELAEQEKYQKRNNSGA